MKKITLTLFTMLLFCTMRAQTPVGYWPLNGNANDSSGNGYNGVVQGATLTTDRNNAANKAYLCDTLKYINIGNGGALKPTASVSFGGWFYRADWSSNVHDEGMLGCTQGAGYELTLETTGLSAYVHRSGSSYAIASMARSSVSSGWHFVMGTYDGYNTRLYLDGAQTAAVSNGGTYYFIDYIANDILIGCEAGTTSGPDLTQPFFGKADEIRIFNTALTSTQVNSLYLTTLPLHLQSFSVSGNNGIAVLNWTSLNEKDFMRYELERSPDGVNFATLSLEQAKPASARNVYSISDATVIKGQTYYYRLKMVDKDGSFTYSDIAKFSTSGIAGKLEIYPNPVSDFFTMKGIDNVQSVQILNLQGNLVKRFPPSANNQYPVTDLRPGIYSVRVQVKDHVVTARLVK